MPVELRQHYVAFLDVLGFSEMVHADVISQDQRYLSKLFSCHQSAANIFRDDPSCTITQFSDSVVIARPYEADYFQQFATSVARYQRLLLDEELLCRGGIAVNKHFSNGSFTFSAGVIAAYKLESLSARYPRVVVSKDLLDLVFADSEVPRTYLVEEDDGLYFTDYIGITRSSRPKRLQRSIANVVSRLLDSANSSLREKGLWLAAYSDAVLGTSLGLPKFQNKRIPTKRAPPPK